MKRRIRIYWIMGEVVYAPIDTMSRILLVNKCRAIELYNTKTYEFFTGYIQNEFSKATKTFHQING